MRELGEHVGHIVGGNFGGGAIAERVAPVGEARADAAVGSGVARHECIDQLREREGARRRSRAIRELVPVPAEAEKRRYF